MRLLNILGIDIGGTNVKLGLVTDQGQILDFVEFPSESQKGGPYLIGKIMEKVESMTNYDKIGISTAGQVDSEAGRIIYANDNIPNYTGTDLKKIFEDRFKKETRVENDVNAAALGEAYFGSMKDQEDFLCLTYGTGVGGAIVVDRKIYKGRDNVAGEFGHIKLYPRGRKCNCGLEGCYERYASTNALVMEGLKISDQYKNGRAILNGYEMGDESLVELVDNWTYDIALGLATLVHIFNPSNIVLGGGIMENEIIIDRVRKNLDLLIMESFKGLKLTRASLGNKAGVLGAASLHLKD